MLAGCSSALLSPRHRLRSEALVHLPEKQKQNMGTQRFDLPCGFSHKDVVPRVSLSLEKPPTESRLGTSSTCSFRQQNPTTPSSSSAMVALIPPWEGQIERAEGRGGVWERRMSSKRVHDWSSSEEDYQAKRTRLDGINRLVGGSGDDSGGGGNGGVWFPEEPTFLVEEEEKVLLVPNAASFPVLTSSSDTLVGSFGTDYDIGTSEGPNDKSQSDSSSSSGAHGWSPELNRNNSGSGSRNPHSSGAAAGVAVDTQAEEQGLELVSLLTSCSESISLGNFEGVNFLLSRLGELASPTGTSIHRLAAYFTEALALRAAKLWPRIFSVSPPKSLADPVEDEDAIALQLLNYVNPIPKFLHFTANERLLRAFNGKERVHIIDFDIEHGLQWPSLLQSLASRPGPPSHVRITGVGESRQDLQDTGGRLARLAETLNLPFEFHAVVDRLEDVRLWMLHVKREECVAVSCVLTMHKALYDSAGNGIGGGGGALTDLLGLIKSTNPSVVVMAEQEAMHDDPRWETRFANSLTYYAAIFDSLDYSLPRDSPARIKAEEVMFAREIRNIVACEGAERIERHRSFDRWRKLMEDGGFRCAGMGASEFLQSQMILRMYSCDSYSIEQQQQGGGEAIDGITLKWLDQPLYTVSAWTPIDMAGSSSATQAK